MTLRYNPQTDGNPYEEAPCPDCPDEDAEDVHCASCNDTGRKPVLVACHDRWWVRLLKWVVR